MQSHQSDGVPRFFLSLSAADRQSIGDDTTLADGIQFTIGRETKSQEEPCIFRWTPLQHGYGVSGLVLRHCPEEGEALKVAVYETETAVGNAQPLHSQDPFVVAQSGDFRVWELQSGSDISFKIPLPREYRKKLIPGETYELWWPGGEISLWDWGTIQHHLGRELKPKKTKIILPAGPCVSFEAVPYAEFLRTPWPPAILPSARIRTAPILNITLSVDGPLEMSQLDGIRVQIMVTYEGVPENVVSRPITFHKYALENTFYELSRRGKDGWKYYEEQMACARIMDDPDVQVSVGSHEHFVSLQPGESWVTSQLVDDSRWDISEDASPGDIFRLQFMGCVLDWWDWGYREEHANTIVSLPCWIWSTVSDPNDNNGRPELIVPASNSIDFTYIG